LFDSLTPLSRPHEPKTPSVPNAAAVNTKAYYEASANSLMPFPISFAWDLVGSGLANAKIIDAGENAVHPTEAWAARPPVEGFFKAMASVVP